MAIMYIAKVSASSQIYDFYEDHDLYQEFIRKLYSAITPDLTIQDEYNNQYKFNSLMFDEYEMKIAGRYSKIYDGKVESYNFDEDRPMNEKKENLSSTVNFYFDVQNELIAYTASREFGYKMFAQMFQKYIETALKDDNIKVAVELLINKEELLNRIKSLSTLEELTFSIIPPNPPNREEFNELFGDRAEAIYGSGATQYKETYEIKSKKSGNGIKLIRYFDRIVSTIKNGYGSVTAKGINIGGNSETITSSDNAPRKHVIDTKRKDSIPYIQEEGEKIIRTVIQEGNRIKQGE